MFTTQIGPPNLSDEYLEELRDCLLKNLGEDSTLVKVLGARTGFGDVATLEREDFDGFFELSVPKMLAAVLEEEDWHVDPDAGITIFKFERQWKEGTYKMLHLVMDVKRNNPPRKRRAPGARCREARTAYRTVVRQLFSSPIVLISNQNLDEQRLGTSLERIKSRRRSYYSDEEA